MASWYQTIPHATLHLPALPSLTTFLPAWAPSVLACTALASTYVASVYALPSPRPRDHPSTIRRRIIGVSVSTTAALTLCASFCHVQPAELNVLDALGLGLPLASQAGAVALALGAFALLFAGPILHGVVDGDLLSGRSNWRSLMFWRNYVVAPATEELLFRCCLVPLLAPALGASNTLWAAPLFFGVAHLHHLLGGEPPVLVAAQFAYTTLFGWLAALAFWYTRSAFAAIAVHAFCNWMGFPDVGSAFSHPRHAWLLRTAYVVGLAGAVVVGREAAAAV